MKRVLKIFVHDLVGLSRNIFALIIAVGLCIIPSLYAWFNIYSNWDPYANTSSIKVAVVSQDAGYKNSDGKNVNMGEEVLDTLRKNTGLGWQILGTYDEAIDGVKSGKYYAAIVLGEDFSKNMFDFIDNGLVHPSVTYYENEKKNAVAVVNVKNVIAMKLVNVDAIVKNVTVKMIAIAKNVIVKTAVASYR